MNAALERIRGQSFVIIGRAGMDFYADPPPTRMAEASRFVSALGGSSANIAAGLCRQGCSASLVTCVSDDAVGRYVRNQLAHYGVDDTYVRSVGGEARNSLAVVDTRNEDHSSVIYRNGAADFEMNDSDIEGVPFDNFSALITTGTVLASEPSRSATFRAFDTARAAGVPLIFDIDYRPYTWGSAREAAETYSRAGEYCDVVIGNDEEFGFMAGDYDKGLDKARSLVGNRASVAVYKKGEKGATTITVDGEFDTGIFEVDALKPTGAGDAFMSGFVAALASGRELSECVSRGAACGAIVVTRVGCAPAMPTPAEIDTFIAGYPG